MEYCTLDFQFSFPLEDSKFNFFSQKHLSALRTLHVNNDCCILNNRYLPIYLLKNKRHNNFLILKIIILLKSLHYNNYNCKNLKPYIQSLPYISLGDIL